MDIRIDIFGLKHVGRFDNVSREILRDFGIIIDINEKGNHGDMPP
jgi:hypothetical protein